MFSLSAVQNQSSVRVTLLHRWSHILSTTHSCDDGESGASGVTGDEGTELLSQGYNDLSGEGWRVGGEY